MRYGIDIAAIVDQIICGKVTSKSSGDGKCVS